MPLLFMSNPLQLLFLSCLFQFFTLSISQTNYVYNCNTSLNYTSGSAYEQNLNQTLKSLSLNASLNGFNTATFGQNNETVYGLIQCWAYISTSDCQTCADYTSNQIKTLCPNQKQAYIAHVNCSLRYSNQSFFSAVLSNGMFLYGYNTDSADDLELFNQQLGNLYSNLSSRIASVDSRYAYGVTRYTDSVNIYSLVQCTRDLQEDSCVNCLQSILGATPTFCNGKIGCFLVYMSCYFRAELYSFVSNQSILVLAPPPPPPPPPPSSSTTPTQSSSNTTTNTNPTSTQVGNEGKGATSRDIVIVAASLGGGFAVIFAICGCLFWKFAKRKRADKVDDESQESLVFSLTTLKAATNDFSEENKIGEGGFGSVYKGKLFDGREIAVKRLASTSGQGLEELKTEVKVVAKLLHRNLVSLLGFCIQEDEKLLMYEFLPNGSLDKVLFDQARRCDLKWETRFRIVVGFARGLLYLHEESQLKIIHRDLKTSNILLDNHMNPKISDFGLARRFCESQTQANTNRIAGTFGYMAPEYIKNGNFSTKSDVYSFGIIVLEIVTGRKNSLYHDAVNLQTYAWENWSNGSAMEVLDLYLKDDQCPKIEVLKCIHIGLLCIQEAASSRPTTSQIVTMLSSDSITFPHPLRPAFYVRSKEMVGSDSKLEEEAFLGYSEFQSQSRISVNEVTITKLESR